MKAQRDTTQTLAAAERDESHRRTRARMSAWLLALLVLAFYVGFIVIGAVKSFGG
jgi:uncharacterized membrane protein (DUF485 family)